MKKIKSLNIAILTVSDSRNETTDKSGNILKKKSIILYIKCLKKKYVKMKKKKSN